MKIYLAGAFSRREEICEYAKKLEYMGHEVTSRWLTQETIAAAATLNSEELEEFLSEHAYMDLEDVVTADAIVRFSDAEEMGFPLVDSRLCSGARHTEFGFMLATHYIGEMLIKQGFGKPVQKLMFVVGGNQNIFDRLQEVMHIKDVEQMYRVFELALWYEVLPKSVAF